jgi:plasmid stability protein
MNPTYTRNPAYTGAGLPPARIESLGVIDDGPDRIITVRWAAGKRGGREDRVDLSPLIDTLRVYAPLRKNTALFATAHLIDDGFAIAWGDDAIDMPAESVERLAAEAMTRADFSAFLERHALTHQAAAAVLGRSKRQIENYLQSEHAIPRVVALACYGYEARREEANLASGAVPPSAPVGAESQGRAETSGFHGFHEEAVPWMGPVSGSGDLRSVSGRAAVLHVHDVDEEIVRALKERAMAHGRSTEAEHRAILAEALVRPRKRSFAEVLASIPDVGEDADFERVQSDREAPRVFD